MCGIKEVLQSGYRGNRKTSMGVRVEERKARRYVRNRNQTDKTTMGLGILEP
jgi:hypothetical protein